MKIFKNILSAKMAFVLLLLFATGGWAGYQYLQNQRIAADLDRATGYVFHQYRSLRDLYAKQSAYARWQKRAIYQHPFIDSLGLFFPDIKKKLSYKVYETRIYHLRAAFRRGLPPRAAFSGIISFPDTAWLSQPLLPRGTPEAALRLNLCLHICDQLGSSFDDGSGLIDVFGGRLLYQQLTFPRGANQRQPILFLLKERGYPPFYQQILVDSATFSELGAGRIERQTAGIFGYYPPISSAKNDTFHFRVMVPMWTGGFERVEVVLQAKED